jgi:putative PIG3 family NAD(P)H quinone oxidoreductase
MKAVLLQDFGGPEVLYLGEVETPKPQAGQVLIRVMATSVNRPDIVQRQGHYPAPPGESEILGLEVAGVVEEVGVHVSEWQVGDRVMALVGGGGYAEFAVADARHVMRIPESMSFNEAACVCETYITAYLNVFLIGELEDGDTVLLHGGGGGVNTAAIHLCKALTPAVKVMVTASPNKIEGVKKLGVDLVIDYTTQDFADEVRVFTHKQGARVILDHIGAAYLASNMKALGVGGKLVIIGVMGGIKAELNLALMMVKRQQIVGSVLRSRSAQEKATIIAKFANAVLPRMSDRTIVPVIDRVYGLNDAEAAHRAMETSTHFGKLVLAIAGVTEQRSSI